MSPASDIPASPATVRWRHAVPLALTTVLLALALLRPPQAVTPEPDRSYQTVLYETLRQGRAWGEALVTTDGPLAALQTPGYLTGSVWMAMGWQIAGNLLLAALLCGAAFRLPWSRRWWALAFLGIILARLPSLAPWLVLVILGNDLVRRWDRDPFAVWPAAGLMGFLALSSLGHLLLGLLTLGLMSVTARPPTAKLAAWLGFAVALLLGWYALGQNLNSLGWWLARGLPALWQTSSLLRLDDISAFFPWALAVALLLATALVRLAGKLTERDYFRAEALFLLGALWLAWKAIALQPFGLPAVFFSTALLAAFILQQRGLGRHWATPLMALALGVLVAAHPLLLRDGLGHLNRQIEVNVKLLAGLPQLRANLRAEVAGLRQVYPLPRIRQTVGAATISVLGAAPGQAMLNGLDVTPAPVPADVLLRTPALARLNRAALAGPAAPAFVLQGLQTTGASAPALFNADAQLELYRQYDLMLEENGYLLWRRKTAGTAPAPAARLVAEGRLGRDEPLRLPQTPGAVYWLEIEPAPSIAGRIWAWLDEIPPAGLLARDPAGDETRYALPTATTGLLVEPLVRGEVDFIRRQSGSTMPRTAEVALAPGWAWAGTCRYRLYAVAGLNLNGQTLPATALEQYRPLSRPPTGVAHAFPFSRFETAPGRPALFAHPPSLLEFAVTGTDRRIRGSLGILEGAYRGTNATDGVDFSIEYLGSDGSRQSLYHRYLDPLLEPADRGPQGFDLALPPGPGGRVLLRTDNAPERGAAWDWAFWQDVVIE